MVIFIVFVQYVVVNFFQFLMMIYVLVICVMSVVLVLDLLSGKSEVDWLKMMLLILVVLEKVNIYYLFGLVYYGCLGDYWQIGFFYVLVFLDRWVIVSGGLLECFQVCLKEVEVIICMCNQVCCRFYEYLLLSWILVSINI